MLATYDLWAFVSRQLGRALPGVRQHDQGLGHRDRGSFAIGLVLGAARAYRVPVVSQFTAVYVEVIRCTPILVQIFMIYFGLGQIGIRFDLFTAAWLSVTLWGGAFNSENFRAGFVAVSAPSP